VIIEALFAVLSMAAVEPCNTIPISHKESEPIISKAWELFSDKPASSEFEFAEVTRCNETVVLNDGREKHIDKTTFVGRFSDRSSIPDVRIHDAVSCNIILYVISGIPDRSTQRCHRKIETFLTFSGIPHEITVSEGSDLGAVRQYLGHLSRQVGTIIDGRLFTEDEFRQISSVRVTSNSRRSHFYARYHVKGSKCTTASIESKATGESVFEFFEIERGGTVC
jgi:hypothetical protein